MANPAFLNSLAANGFQHPSEEQRYHMALVSAECRVLADGGVPLDLTEGLCYHLELYALNRDLVLRCWPAIHAAFETWEHFSGHMSYPVPALKKFMLNPDEDMVVAYVFFEDKWTGEYGRMRRLLCQHIADVFDEFLAEYVEPALPT